MKKLTDKELNKVIKLIKEQGLDTTWLNYGGFLYKNELKSYHPDHRKEAETYSEMYRISVGPLIYQVVPGDYQTFIDEIQAEKFRKFLDKETKSKRYVEDLEYRFNAYKYEVTAYSDSFINILGNKEWWISQSQDRILALYSDSKTDEEAYKEAEESAKNWMKFLFDKGIEATYEIAKKFIDVNFIGDELNDIRKMKPSFGFKEEDTIFLHQVRRVTEKQAKEISGMTKVTLPSTGRKVLLNIHKYGTIICHITPIV